MKSDVLERLLIDGGAGELSPDVQELLEAHLEREPAARSEAAEIEETLRLAKLALACEPVILLPRPQRSRRLPSWAWAMAACFVCGLSLGIYVARARIAPPLAASVPSRQTAATTLPREPGFWSVSRLRAVLPPVPAKTENRIVWKSPVKKPEIL